MAARATIRFDRVQTNQVGKKFVTGEAEELAPTTSSWFHLIDDDGVIYYSGRIESDNADHEDTIFNRLYDWGAAYAGTTLLVVDGQAVIG